MSSSLTYTSASAASGEGILSSLSPQNQSTEATTMTSSQTPTLVKRKRGLPGNPDPDSEVIALSPWELTATNSHVCEICNKGFQREQNLQLHRRQHNLPWRLKQRNDNGVSKKKVYVCPEVNCVHHDPSRALADLTGIKKHFSRKHGEKKWKCEKCSKKYAVQSDWKVHSKSCGIKEYRCDCGTLFARKDSYITHRAFCDALAEESARTPIMSLTNPLQQHHISTSAASPLTLQPQYFHTQQQEQQHYNLIKQEMPAWLSCPQPIDLSTSAASLQPQYFHTQQQHYNLFRPELPPWLSCSHSIDLTTSSPSMYSTSFEHKYSQQTPTHENKNGYQQQISSSFAASSALSPHMSATALLQKAAQMGATIGKPSSSAAPTATAASLVHSRVLLPHHSHMTFNGNNNNPTAASTTSVATTETGFGFGLSSHEDIENGSDSNFCVAMSTKAAMSSGNFMDHHISAQTQQQQLEDMMNSLSSTSGGFDTSASCFAGQHHMEQAFDSTRRSSNESNNTSESRSAKTPKRGGNGGMTRDFLGLRAFSHMNVNMAGCNNKFEHHQQQQ
ncbi:hypothetical protein MKW94_000807 [Papaver nudicaule]|uniref:C2H2-type domain-containing protein n=1 Tax=Papaver nudicaule TaxID=74823 RepID=A0AA41SN85_PAPNU|nr:hypothetical protein [Papaver nudicaule]